MNEHSNDPLVTLVPDPIAIHTRLGELGRERRLLRRQLRLSMQAREEVQRRGARRDSNAQTALATA